MPGDLSVILPASHAQNSHSYALALKDIVELAQAFHHSPHLKDFPDAQSTAGEVGEVVDQINEFCGQHCEVLDDSVDAENIIFDLLRDLKVAQEQCNRIPPALDQEESRKPGMSLNLWKDSSKLEASLVQLRDRVDKHHAQIMMCGMEGEDNQITLAIQESTTHALVAIQQQTSSWAADERIVDFSESDNSVTLAGRPPMDSTCNIADGYIRDQVAAIDKRLAEFSSPWSYVDKSTKVHSFPYQYFIPSYATQDGATLRQDVIAKISKIQELLRNDCNLLSIRKGALEMMDLANALYSVDLVQEATTIGLWTIKLFRTLVSNGAEIYCPYLSLSLRYLSLFYMKMIKLDEAESAIEEAAKISRSLHATSEELEVKAQIVAVLTTYAHVVSLKKDYGKSLEYAEQAVQLFELLMEENCFGDGSSNLRLIRTEEEWADALANFPDQAICDYARALARLSETLSIHGRRVDAVQALIKASTIMAFVSRYHVDGVLDPELAWMFYQLSHEQFRDTISWDEALGYSHKAVEMYRTLYRKNTKRYAERLCEALWKEACTLETMERHEAALGFRKEAANAAKEIPNRIFHAVYLEQLSSSLRRLKRYDEAVTTRTEAVSIYSAVLDPTSPAVASAYTNVSLDLRDADRFPEAIEAAEKALAQYRIFASVRPSEYMKELADGLNDLIFTLIMAKEIKRAFKEGLASLKLHERLIVDNPTILPYYKRCLAVNTLVSFITDKSYKKRSLRRMREVLHHSRELAQRFPPEPGESSIVIKAIRIQSMVLSNKADRIDGARAGLQEALHWYYDNPATSARAAEQHMDCLISFRNLLDDQGCMEETLEPLAKAVEIGKPFSDDSEVACNIAHVMCLQVAAFLKLGMFSEFTKASEEAVAFARRSTVKVYHLAGCLVARSLALKHTGRSEEAVTVLNEALTALDQALERCRGNVVAEATNGRVCLEIYLPVCYSHLSDNLANTGRESEALTAAQKAVDTARGLRGKYMTMSWEVIEPLYVGCLHVLCLRLAVNGELSRALEIAVECRKYNRGRSKARKGCLPQLASVMRAEALMHCAAGQHAEGTAARRKFIQLLKRLRSNNPSLARLVEIELDLESSLVSWSNLLAELDLKCHHQDEGRASPRLVNRLANRFRSLVHA